MIEKLRRAWNRFQGRPYWYVPYYTNKRPSYFGFDDLEGCVGAGWSKILGELSEKLFKLGWDGGLQQVKEKFGGLRFYWQNNIQDPTLASIARDAVEVAEWRSTQTCETCGKYGKTRGGGWILTLCDEHWKETVADRAARGESEDDA